MKARSLVEAALIDQRDRVESAEPRSFHVQGESKTKTKPCARDCGKMLSVNRGQNVCNHCRAERWGRK